MIAGIRMAHEVITQQAFEVRNLDRLRVAEASAAPIISRGYESLADREARRGAKYADPDWQESIGEIWEIEAILAQDVMITNPARFASVVAMARV